MLKRFQAYIRVNQKYLPVLFFIIGFLWDSLTLGRVDRLYDQVILSSYLILLSIFLYLFNRSPDGKWENTFLEPYQEYFPLAIQFFLGGLCSAYVIYFSRSVSFTKTLFFFLILVFLFLANELLKKRISNKYLQFSAYFFVNFTFFIFFIPTILGTINKFIFLLSGCISLGITLALIIYIYNESPSTRDEIHLGKIFGLILLMYLTINTFYFLNLIPPVPLALDEGLVAYDIKKIDEQYLVAYEKDPWYVFWREYRHIYEYKPDSKIYVFTSVFAPTDFKKDILHRWNWYSPHTNDWEVIDEISYEVLGGRDDGYRGYTYKNKMMIGEWKVEVVTKEGLVLGNISFKIKEESEEDISRLSYRVF